MLMGSNHWENIFHIPNIPHDDLTLVKILVLTVNKFGGLRK